MQSVEGGVYKSMIVYSTTDVGKKVFWKNLQGTLSMIGFVFQKLICC